MSIFKYEIIKPVKYDNLILIKKIANLNILDNKKMSVIKII